MKSNVVNLEQGMPTVERARMRLADALRNARRERVDVLKVIHGYGSSGKGGAIRRDVRQYLAQQRREGRIREFVPGEEFSPFHEPARNMLSACGELARDRDYSRCNHGITMVLL